MMKKIGIAAWHGAVVFLATFAGLMALFVVEQRWLTLPEWADEVLLMWGIGAWSGLAATLYSEKRQGGHTFLRRCAFFAAVTLLLTAVIAGVFLVKRPELIDGSLWEAVVMCWILSVYAWFSIAAYLSLCHLLEWLTGRVLKRGNKGEGDLTVSFRFRPLWEWLASVPFFLVWYWFWMRDL